MAGLLINKWRLFRKGRKRKTRTLTSVPGPSIPPRAMDSLYGAGARKNGSGSSLSDYDDEDLEVEIGGASVADLNSLQNTRHDQKHEEQPQQVLGFFSESDTETEPSTHELEYGIIKSPKPCKPVTVKPKKKKRRKKLLTICTSNCKYDAVRRTAQRFGMHEVGDDDLWNLFWTDYSVSLERAIDMKRFQKINHFPGMIEICRKDMLARNMNRLKKMFPKEYDIFPNTWCLPADLGDLQCFMKNKRNKTFICKPDTGCQGKGIFLIKNLREIRPNERTICQLYISKPFLIDGYKFDLRVYVLLTSCDPLRIYVYKEGLARFSTEKYAEPNSENLNNQFMHLTNYAVNKHNIENYVVDDESGSKRKISATNRWLRNNGYNITELWMRIDDIIVKTIISAYSTLRHNYRSCFPHHDKASACFEILGFDVLLDHNLKPYILEVNHSPSFHTECLIDERIKETLLMDTFEIINLGYFDRKKVLDEDRKRAQERLLHKTKENKNDEEALEYYHTVQASYEDAHCGNYRLVFPPKDGSKKYDKFFEQNLCSLYQDTAASRAREECTRIQQEEFHAKLVEEMKKRPKARNREPRPESPDPQRKTGPLKPRTVRKKIENVKSPHLCSFDPSPIKDSEEEERLRLLSVREKMIRMNGLDHQIYQNLHEMGLLQLSDVLNNHELYNHNKHLMVETGRHLDTFANNVSSLAKNFFCEWPRKQHIFRVASVSSEPAYSAAACYAANQAAARFQNQRKQSTKHYTPSETKCYSKNPPEPTPPGISILCGQSISIRNPKPLQHLPNSLKSLPSVKILQKQKRVNSRGSVDLGTTTNNKN